MNKTLIISFNLLGLVSTAMAQKTTNPNIIFILADDMGYGDVKALNKECKIPTPNLDQLAQEGVTFTDAHTTSAVSTPSRYGILTGRYNWRSRLKNGVLHPYDPPLVSPYRTTMASMLRAQGYQTACIGKWHLGMQFATTDGQKPIDSKDECNIDFSKEFKGGPCDVGFDYFFGVDAPNFPPYSFLENRKIVGKVSQYYPINKTMDARAGRGEKQWDFEKILPTITYKASEYIKKASKEDEPFFLYLPLTSPHTPIVPTKSFMGRTGLNLYTDFVMQTDACIGKILQTLKESGEEKNTIIVFTTDNGCSPRADFDFLTQKGHDPSYIFRGMKSDLYEGGHHVPCFVRWPQVIKSHVVNQTICLTDFMATFAKITNYKLSGNEAEDSYNILPLLTCVSQEPNVIREATVHHSINGEFAIRQGKWKLLLANYSGGWSAPTNRDIVKAPFLLYNLEEDPEETTDLSQLNPKKVKELRSLLIKYIKDGRSTKGIPQKNDPVDHWKQLTYWMY